MSHGEPFIDVALLTLLAITAVAIAVQRNLLSAVMLAGIFSLLGAAWMLFLDAPDVAFTEAAVGAGISTVLLLATLSATGGIEKPGKGSPLALGAVVVTGATLVYATFDMPRVGDPNSPANRSPITRVYIDSAQEPQHHSRGDSHGDGHGEEAASYKVGIPNTVTTVLASFRGYDTMGETAVIFAAGFGVVLILTGARRRRFSPGSEPERGEDEAGS